MAVREKIRDSNIELLRIFLMLLIVIHHLIVHGSNLVNAVDLDQTFSSYQKLFYESFLLFPVNCYIFISGYYGIRINFSKILNFWMQCFFYSVGITVLFALFSTNQVSYRIIIKSFFPILTNQWWFASGYFFLYLFSPVLNTLTNTVSKKMYHYILIIGILLNPVASFLSHSPVLGGTGSSLMNFFFLYILGRYFHKNSDKIMVSRKKLLLVFFLSTAIMLAISVLLFSFDFRRKIWQLYQFNNPLIVVQAISMFLLFKTFSIKNKSINTISSLIFSVYLLHDNVIVRDVLYRNIFIIDNYSMSFSYGAYLILFALIICITALLVEVVRRFIMSPIIHYMLKTQVSLRLEEFFKTITTESHLH